MTDASYHRPQARFRQANQIDASRVKRRAKLKIPAILFSLVVIAGYRCGAQTSATPVPGEPPADNPVLRELQSEVHELKQLVLQLQQQTVDSHAEITRLRQELETRSAATTDGDAQGSSYIAPTNAELDTRLTHIQEDQQLIADKVNDQYQTKVESASKYRVRFSGIVLFNLFGNSGSVENQDVPTWATRGFPTKTSGSIGATMR